MTPQRLTSNSGLLHSSRDCGKQAYADYTPWFDDASDFLPATSAPVLLTGESGVGKSNLVEDIYMLGAERGLNTTLLSVNLNHILESTGEKARTMLESTASLGANALLVVDNLDFLVHSGGRQATRDGAKIRCYFDRVGGAIESAVQAGCLVLATTHSQNWLDSHTLRTRADVLDGYEQLLSSLGTPLEFTGKLDMDNAIRLLKRRGLSSELADEMARELQNYGKLEFKYVQNLGVNLYNSVGVSRAYRAVDKKTEILNELL